MEGDTGSKGTDNKDADVDGGLQMRGLVKGEAGQTALTIAMLRHRMILQRKFEMGENLAENPGS
jgi:hypothetical protein